MSKPLAIDLFCGLGGWTEGLLAEGYNVIGFDIEIRPYPAQLVIQDVLTLHGSQFKDAALIVASPPCQEFSCTSLPFKQFKGLIPKTDLFKACFRIQREASEAAGQYIPLIVENVRGAQKWVGQAKAKYGSFYLWGDVGMVGRRVTGINPKFGESLAGRITKNSNSGSWFGAYSDRKNRWAGNHSTTSSKSKARKKLVAEIAKIPFPLAQHIARVYKA